MRKLCGWGYHNARGPPNVGNLSSKLTPLKWNLILIKRICGLIHKFSRLINVFSTTFCLSSSCVFNILVHIYLPSLKLQNCSGGIHSNVACYTDFACDIFSSLSLLQPFTVHYENIHSRRYLLLCATSERDYIQQHWVEMLALPRQKTIMPLSGRLHRVRRY